MQRDIMAFRVLVFTIAPAASLSANKTSDICDCVLFSSLNFRGEVFSVGDGIYLEPGTFENVQKWNTAIANNGRGQQMIDKSVDTTLHTEYVSVCLIIPPF